MCLWRWSRRCGVVICLDCGCLGVGLVVCHRCSLSSVWTDVALCGRGSFVRCIACVLDRCTGSVVWGFAAGGTGLLRFRSASGGARVRVCVTETLSISHDEMPSSRIAQPLPRCARDYRGGSRPRRQAPKKHRPGDSRTRARRRVGKECPLHSQQQQHTHTTLVTSPRPRIWRGLSPASPAACAASRPLCAAQPPPFRPSCGLPPASTARSAASKRTVSEPGTHANPLRELCTCTCTPRSPSEGG